MEIDESLFSKRKYNRGRVLQEQWIFGGYDPVDKKGFLVPVPKRDAATLLPIVQQCGVTTNHVEAMWQRAKTKFKAQHGSTNREMIPDYLAEFMWFQQFGENPFFNFWTKWQQTCILYEMVGVICLILLFISSITLFNIYVFALPDSPKATLYFASYRE